MKLFKRVALTLAACAVALSALTGCSRTSAYTMSGTVRMSVGGQQVVTDAPMTIVSDGKASYTKYELEGSTVEALTVGTEYYERTYATGTEGAKWAKAALQATETAADTTLKTGTMTIDGVEYQTQTYDETTYYCFDTDGALRYAYTQNGDSEVTIRIDSISTDVDESLLKAPDASQVEAAK